MLVDPLPTPHFEFTAGRFDEVADFSSPKTIAWGSTTTVIAGGAPKANTALSSLATAIEKCFLIPVAGQPNQPTGFTYDGGECHIERDGSGNPTGIKDIPTSGSAIVFTLGEAYSLAAELRSAGYGTPFVP